LPLAVGSIAFCALSDYFLSGYVWRQHEVDVVRLTGFKNGIYVNPERMEAMRRKMNITDKLKEFEDEDGLIIENDEV
jgi:hypothetical protein